MQPIIRNAIACIDVMQQGRSISRGTGFLVADGLVLVLTALHVVADRNQQSLTPYPGEIVLAFPHGSTKAAIYENYWDRLADWVLQRCETPPDPDVAIWPWRATWKQWLQAARQQLSSHPDFANPLPATGRQSGGVRASKLLKVSVSFDDENTQLAREACQERIWETKER